MSNEIEKIVLGIFETKLGKAVGARNLHNDDILVSAIADFGFDSLEKAEIIMDIEDAFHIMLNEDSVLKCKNVGNLIELISSTRKDGMSDK